MLPPALPVQALASILPAYYLFLFSCFRRIPLLTYLISQSTYLCLPLFTDLCLLYLFPIYWPLYHSNWSTLHLPLYKPPP